MTVHNYYDNFLLDHLVQRKTCGFYVKELFEVACDIFIVSLVFMFIYQMVSTSLCRMYVHFFIHWGKLMPSEEMEQVILSTVASMRCRA